MKLKVFAPVVNKAENEAELRGHLMQRFAACSGKDVAEVTAAFNEGFNYYIASVKQGNPMKLTKKSGWFGKPKISDKFYAHGVAEFAAKNLNMEHDVTCERLLEALKGNKAEDNSGSLTIGGARFFYGQ